MERRINNDLLVSCPNKAHGCEWTGCLADLKYHLNSDSDRACHYLLMSCPLKCGNLHELKDIREHVTLECTHRKVHCEHCGLGNVFYLLEEHYTECNMFPVPCPSACGKFVRRNDLEDHERKECVNRSAACLFHSVGCEAVVAHKDYEAHVQECKEKYMVKAHEKLLLETLSLKDELSKMKEENQFLHSEIASLHTGLLVCHENAGLLREENSQLKSILVQEMSHLHSMASPGEALSVECVKTHLRGQVVHLLPGGESTTFRITDYLGHRGNDGVWYSPPFYIAQGCKFCLAVHVNGKGAGKGTHVAVYLHQMSGLLDSDLSWPILLEEDIEVRLMRQELSKESKISVLKSMWGLPKSPSSPSSSHSRSTEVGVSPLLSLDSPPMSSRSHNVYTSRNPPLEDKLYLQASVNVIECQIMSLSQVLNQPAGDSPELSIAKLELFCLQKTFENSVIHNSAVIQCRLIANQGNMNHPIRTPDKGWKAAEHDR